MRTSLNFSRSELGKLPDFFMTQYGNDAMEKKRQYLSFGLLPIVSGVVGTMLFVELITRRVEC